jgi:hypothetical protein
MITILEIQQASAVGFFHQFGHHALPDPTPLVLQQPPVTRLGGGPNIVRQILPTTPRVQDIQNPIQYLAFIGAGPTGPRRTRDEPSEIVPLSIGQIGLIGFAWHARQRSAARISSATAFLSP